MSDATTDDAIDPTDAEMIDAYNEGYHDGYTDGYRSNSAGRVAQIILLSTLGGGCILLAVAVVFDLLIN